MCEETIFKANEDSLGSDTELVTMEEFENNIAQIANDFTDLEIRVDKLEDKINQLIRTLNRFIDTAIKYLEG